MPKRWLSCRVNSYREYQDNALAHIASLGIRFVELRTPMSESELHEVRRRLDAHGLRAATLQGRLDLSREDTTQQIMTQLPAFVALGVRHMLIATQAGAATPFETACQRLRAAGTAAAEHGVTIVVETHPDLVTNADVALKTLAAVDHPAVRVNFDTANLYYYNEQVDAVADLRRMAHLVAAVHLKDTNGAYQQWHFPALGRGIVDFPAMFATLDAAGYAGPFTLEIEGIAGEARSERLVHERVAESVAFLRNLETGWE